MLIGKHFNIASVYNLFFLEYPQPDEFKGFSFRGLINHIVLMIRALIINYGTFVNKFVCLYIWFFGGGVYRPIRKFFTHIETSPLPVKGCKFWPICSTLMAIEQWGFFSVLHLLWHGASVYNGHLRGPMTLKPITER